MREEHGHTGGGNAARASEPVNAQEKTEREEELKRLRERRAEEEAEQKLKESLKSLMEWEEAHREEAGREEGNPKAGQGSPEGRGAEERGEETGREPGGQEERKTPGKGAEPFDRTREEARPQGAVPEGRASGKSALEGRRQESWEEEEAGTASGPPEGGGASWSRERPGTRGTSVPEGKPETRGKSEPEGKPGTKGKSEPAGRPGTQERSEPVGRPGTQERSEPVGRPGTQERSESEGKPGTKGRSEPAGRPGTQERSEPDGKPGTRDRQKKKKKKGGFRRVLGRVFLTLFIILAVGLAGGGILAWKFYSICKEEVEGIVADSTEEDFLPGQASYFYDSAGNVLAKISGDEDSQYLPYEEIPEDAVNAFIAIEDRTFWENCGVDFKGIVRVGINFILTEGEEVHGASTITQQLARNRYLTREVSIKRKVKEMIIAMELTEKYTKEQIMEFYVNDINYANTYYGLQAAAKGYFGKDADELSLSQIAYLCAIPNSPSYYNPYRHPENALVRRDKILGDMLEMGFITKEEHDQAVSEEIAVSRTAYEMRNYETTYAIDCAVRWLMERDGFQFEYGFSSYDDYNAYQAAYEESYARAKDELYTGGYRIATSIDPAKQAILQAAVDQGLAFDAETGENGIYALQGAAVAVNNDTGKVEAIVGGRSQETNTYTLNRAFQSFRQPGSSIKPLIVYTPALEEGYASFSRVKDISVDAAKKPGADVFSLPGNWITLRQAVEKSRNGAAWWLFNEVTPEGGLSYLTQMRFDKIVPDDYNMAASLGGFTYGVTAEEMAGAFSALENGGVYREPDCIVSMENLDGENIYAERESKQVYSKQSSAVMVDVLKGVISRGTARGMGWNSGIEAAGKTGTTNNSKDGWFCGMTPYYTVTVWVGYDTPRTLSSLYGSSYPAAIWKQAMEGLTAGLPAAAFAAPEAEKEDIHKEGRGVYLEGYDDSYVLSPNYTVGDYRRDHALADEAQKYIDQMAGASPEEQERLRKNAESAINRIYGQTLKGQMREVLEGAGRS